MVICSQLTFSGFSPFYSDNIMNYHEMSRVDDCNYRKSGFMLAGLLALVYVVLFLRGKNQPLVLTGAAVIALAAWFETRLLRKLVNLMIQIGNVMHRFTNPVLFGLIYITAVIPTAFLLKIIGKDMLQLRFDCKLSTYWKARTAGDSGNDSFRNQF